MMGIKVFHYSHLLPIQPVSLGLLVLMLDFLPLSIHIVPVANFSLECSPTYDAELGILVRTILNMDNRMLSTELSPYIRKKLTDKHV